MWYSNLNYWVAISQIISSLAAAGAVIIAFFQLVKKNKELLRMAEALKNQVAISQEQVEVSQKHLDAMISSKPPRLFADACGHQHGECYVSLECVGGDLEYRKSFIYQVNGSALEKIDRQKMPLTVGAQNEAIHSMFSFGKRVHLTFDGEPENTYDILVEMSDFAGLTHYRQRIVICVNDYAMRSYPPQKLNR